MARIRLDRFLANNGCGTRTEVKQLLKKGLVTVNGETMRSPDYKVDAVKDEVKVGNRTVTLRGFRYYMLNKPTGYLSATTDRHQKVVLDLLPEEERKDLFPVGRLDIDTEGLLLLTDDGALAHELLSPAKHVDKTYFARIRGIVSQEDILHFQEGVDIGEKRPAMPAKLEILEDAGELAEGGDLATGEDITAGGNIAAEEDLTEGGHYTAGGNLTTGETNIRVTIQEGKYHQVKRMFEAVGKQVIYLKRISMGALVLDEALERGAYRELTEEEVRMLRGN